MAKITTATGSDADLTLEPDGTGDINLTPGTNGDVNIPANKGITFGAAGEKIEGNATKLDIAAAEIDFSIEAGGDINIGTDIGLTFGVAGEKIEGDGTDLTIASSGDIDLTATNDVNIPAQVGLTFGADTEKIEADASNNVTLSASGDIVLDAGGADITLKDGGTTFGILKQVSGDLVIQPTTSKQIILNDEGGSSALAIDTAGNTDILQNIEQATGKHIQTDEIRARAGDGLKLYDDGGAGGSGIFVEDGGNVRVGSASGTKFNVGGNIMATGNLYVGSYSNETGISTTSNGGSSTTLYIGNASITVSSDERIKENIIDTEIDAMGKLNALRVVDFTWNDPTDTSFNNKNARGKYTGLIAQEVIDVLPFCVNAVREEETLTPQPNAKITAIPDILYEDGEEIPEGKKVGDVQIEGTPETDALWGMQYGYVVPVLIKAIQELSAKVTALESA